MSDSKRRMLLIKASPDIKQCEANQIAAIANHFGLEIRQMDLDDLPAFEGSLCKLGEKYEYIYLAAHADTAGFGDGDGKIFHEWEDLAGCICKAACTTVGTVLFLGCCRGGLRKVATSIFCNCWEIDYICGPRWTVCAEDITTGFHVFVYNMLIRHEQPSVAVTRASMATGYDFFCHDRIELEDEIAKECEELEVNGDDDA